MNEIKNVTIESYSSNLICIFEKIKLIYLRKLTLKTENVQFLLACHYFCVQNIKISFEYADFYAKISLILNSAARNSITQQTLLINLSLNRNDRKRRMLCWS